MQPFPPMNLGDVARLYQRSLPDIIEGNPWPGAAYDIAKLIEDAGHKLTSDQVLALLTVGSLAYQEGEKRRAENNLSTKIQEQYT